MKILLSLSSNIKELLIFIQKILENTKYGGGLSRGLNLKVNDFIRTESLREDIQKINSKYSLKLDFKTYPNINRSNYRKEELGENAKA